MKLSIVIPVYNEKVTLGSVLREIQGVDLGGMEKEIIIVDDCSTDGTQDILKGIHESNVFVYFHKQNVGKGGALRTGFSHVSGDLIVIQDADLEYNPAEYPTLLKPILDGDADVVYGSRFVSVSPRRILYFSHYVANTFLTFLSNVCTGLNLSDMETGYKVFSRHALESIRGCLTATRFGIEPEITAQIAKHDLRVYEVGISYRGRTYKEGKKIGWLDGVAATWHIIQYNLLTFR